MLGERIKTARRLQKLSQAEVGKKMGNISKAAVSKWENGENIPKDIDLLARILKVNIEWLRENKGSMTLNENSIKPISGEGIRDWDYNTLLEDDEIEVPFFESIELFATGIGRKTMDENQEKNKVRISKSLLKRRCVQKSNVICFQASGKSMEPVIPDGAIVTVNIGEKNIKDGSVYVICQNDLYRLRRLYQLPNNKVRIVSYNSDEYPDEIDNALNIQVIGKVFYCSFELN